MCMVAPRFKTLYKNCPRKKSELCQVVKQSRIERSENRVTQLMNDLESIRSSRSGSRTVTPTPSTSSHSQVASPIMDFEGKQYLFENGWTVAEVETSLQNGDQVHEFDHTIIPSYSGLSSTAEAISSTNPHQSTPTWIETQIVVANCRVENEWREGRTSVERKEPSCQDDRHLMIENRPCHVTSPMFSSSTDLPSHYPEMEKTDTLPANLDDLFTL